MMKRMTVLGSILLLCFGTFLRAQETNAPAATNASAVAAAPTANNDPAGGSTGVASDSSGGAGAYTYNVFVAAPAELSADDKKDTNKVAAYMDAKKAADDYAAQAKAEPLAAKLADAVGHNRISINFVWTLVTGFLVMFMQAGFALVETGLCRAKNAAHTMTMNMLIYPLGMLGFWVCGFAFMFGGIGTGPGAGTLGACSSLNHEVTWTLFGKPFGIIGLKGFFLSGDTYDVGLFCLFLFQMVFMDTTATIPTGACAERWKFSAFCLYGCFIGTVMYPVFGNWVWGGGWLAQLGSNFGLGHGHVDFAGSSVVHMQGGVIGLIFAWLIGPRLGKYNKDGSINPIIPHSIPMAVLGTFILAFGWFGFNPGSTLAGTDLRIATVATNTMLASATGCLGAMLWMWRVRTKKPDPSMACNGMLAGLVAITCPCAFVTSVGACALGLVAGILVVESVFFWDKLKIDDPVGAISVHGVCGAWGCLSLGLFGDGAYGAGWNGVHGYMVNGAYTGIIDASAAPKGATEVGVIGLFYGGGFGQFAAELVGVLTCFVTLAVLSFIVYKVVAVIVGGHRVSEEVEVEGLDVPEMGVPGYGGVMMDKDSETPRSK
jgi:Amt family ammonium transporter